MYQYCYLCPRIKCQALISGSLLCIFKSHFLTSIFTELWLEKFELYSSINYLCNVFPFLIPPFNLWFTFTDFHSKINWCMKPFPQSSVSNVRYYEGKSHPGSLSGLGGYSHSKGLCFSLALENAHLLLLLLLLLLFSLFLFYLLELLLDKCCPRSSSLLSFLSYFCLFILCSYEMVSLEFVAH